jgi:hypothetical protein
MQPQSSTETIKQFRMGLGCSSELSGFRRDPHPDSKGPHSLVDASSNGCWRSRYTTRYTVCNYVMCDMYIYICGCLSILSSLIFSYLILSIIIYVYIYICNLSLISNSNCQQLYRWKIHPSPS